MGLKFKVLNWLSGDYLRNYLAIGVRLRVESLKEGIKRQADCGVPCNQERLIKQLDVVLKNIDDIFNM